MTLTLTSPAFADGEEIPEKYTCLGEDCSPALAWTGVPPDCQSLSLIVDDPDAPDPRAPKTIWAHWLLYNLPPDTAGLAERVSPSRLPPGTQEGLNDWHRTGYGGPCPPIGRHRYFFRLYALDRVLEGLKSPTRRKLLAAMEGHVIARVELVGTFRK